MQYKLLATALPTRRPRLRPLHRRLHRRLPLRLTSAVTGTRSSTTISRSTASTLTLLSSASMVLGSRNRFQVSEKGDSSPPPPRGIPIYSANSALQRLTLRTFEPRLWPLDSMELRRAKARSSRIPVVCQGKHARRNEGVYRSCCRSRRRSFP